MKKLLIVLFVLFAFVASAVAGEIKLSWEPIDEASSYQINYGLDSVTLDQTIETGNVIEFTVDGLTIGTMYYFKVRASNGVIYGEWSNGVFGVAKLGQVKKLIAQ